MRLYPIPLRYLDVANVFKKYQWIEADVARALDRDARPESYRIRADEIKTGDVISTTDGTWAERARLVLQPANVFPSVEALQAKQQEDHTSLGIVKPKEVIQIHRETCSPRERESYWRKYKETVAQLPMDFDDETHVPKPLTPPDFRFQVRFTCDHSACRLVHKFSVLDWEVDALYFNLKQKHGQVAAANKVTKHLEKHLQQTDADVRFFLGNISTHPQVFTIVGLWHPTRVKPASLFDIA